MSLPLIIAGLEKHSNIELIPGIYPTVAFPPPYPNKETGSNNPYSEPELPLVKPFERMALLDRIYFAHPMKLSMNWSENEKKKSVRNE